MHAKVPSSKSSGGSKSLAKITSSGSELITTSAVVDAGSQGFCQVLRKRCDLLEPKSPSSRYLGTSAFSRMSRSCPRTALCSLAAQPSRTRCHPYWLSSSIIAQHRPIVRLKAGARIIRSHSTSSSSASNGSSVSASEVGHFTTLASSWWDPHGPSRLLHLMNPLRHDFLRSCTSISSSTPAAGNRMTGHESEDSQDKKYTYLDIGCGGGIFASSAARLPTTSGVTAIDPTPNVIKVAKEYQRGDPLLSQPGRLNYVNCAIEELGAHPDQVPADGFDFVTLFEVIEHIDRPAAFLRQALTHLKPGGWLIGSTIARHPLSYFTTKIVGEAPWPIGVVPRGTHDWDKYINPSELKAWFAKENREANSRSEKDPFSPVKIEGCIYLPVVGWKFINGSEDVGNYFFGVQKLR